MAKIDVVRVDITVDGANPDDGVHKIFQVIKPDWKVQDIRRKPLSEGQGYANINFKYVNTKTDDALVVRVNGEGFNEYVDREQEINIYRLLGDAGMAPKLICLFKNGICMEFLKGRTYNIAKMEGQSLDLAVLTAKEMAKFHCKRLAKLAREKYGISDRNLFLGLGDGFLDSWEPDLAEQIPYIKTPGFPTKEELQAEYLKLKEATSALRMPVVFCHSDCHPGNLIHDEEAGKVILIDYELAGFSTSGSDLALYLFYSFFGLGLNETEEPPMPHSTEFKRAFLKVYLQELSRLDEWSRDVTEDDVNELLAKIDVYLLFLALYHVIIGISLELGSPDQSLQYSRGSLKAWKLYQRLK